MSEEKQKAYNNNINNIITKNIKAKKTIIKRNVENNFSPFKYDDISLNCKIKKLNKAINNLKTQFKKNEIEKKKLILSSNRKENDLKEIKNELSKTKFEAEELKQRITNSMSKDEKMKNNFENNLNLFIQLQNRITDLELQLKDKESNNPTLCFSTNNLFLSPLKRTKNISICIPSSFNRAIKSSSSSDMFMTKQDALSELKINNKNLIRYIDKIKEEISLIGKDKADIKEGMINLKKKKIHLIKIFSNKKNEINNQIDQQSKLSKELIEQLDKSKKFRNHYRKIKIKNKNLEINKKLLEDIISKQDDKVKSLSNSYKNILNLVNDKNEEIAKNKNHIINLEENFKILQKKFATIKNDQSNVYKISELKLKLQKLKLRNRDNKLQSKLRHNLYNRNDYRENQLSNNNLRSNFHSNDEQFPLSFNSFNTNNNYTNSKIEVKNYSYRKDINDNNMKSINKIKYTFNKKNKIDRRQNILKKHKGPFNLDIKNNNKAIYSNDNIILSESISRNKILMNFVEEQKEKEEIKSFKSFINKFVEDLEKKF